MTGRGRCRPARPWGAIPASSGVVAGWWLVAHSSGQGWVQVLGDVVAAGMAVGVIGPWVLLRWARVTVASVPADAVAGRPVGLSLRTTRPLRVTAVEPPGPAALGAGMAIVPTRRGVVTSVTADVACAAPFGLQWWTRRVRLELPSPLLVAPRRGPAGPLPAAADSRGGAAGGGAVRSGAAGDMRAPRPYRPGDPPGLVHWPATAHTGELMVRDLERPTGRTADVAVALPADPERAEEEAERALGTVLALLETGTAVRLTTDEADGLRVALVTTPVEAGRRLARAVGRPAWAGS